MSHLFTFTPLSWLSFPNRTDRPPGSPPAQHWLQALRQRRARHRHDREQAALESCASEGAEVDLRTVELDGQRYGALYRNGELICLLPRVQET